MDISIVYEDNHLIAVNKPAGLLVQGDHTGDETLVESVREFIRETYKKPGNVFCGLIHRLDRPVSGLVVLAKTSKALERMNKLFHDREVHKEYFAIVTKRPPTEEGELSHYLVKDGDKNVTKAYNKPGHGAKLANLRYKLESRIKDEYLLRVWPESGRPHQIRVQLAKMGCPVKGDLKYGSDQKNKTGDIGLHAHALEFSHPVRKEHMRIETPIPKTWIWRFFNGITEWE